MSVAVIYNKSIEETFSSMVNDLKREFETLGEDCFVIDNITLGKLPDKAISFEKCVFFDKDCVQGMRLELLGVKLFNNIGSIELCDDKRKCTEFLKKDFKLPETVCYPLIFRPDSDFFVQFAKETSERLSLPLIAKKAFGSWGEQVYLLNTVDEIIDFQQMNWSVPHLYCRFIKESRGRDLRVYVVGEEAAGAMLRENKFDFRSNIACGGSGQAFPLSAEIEKTAVDICRYLSLDFGGVDFLYSEDGGMYVCEVNSNAMFTTINQVCGVNIAKKIAGHVVNSRSRFDGTDFL